MIDTELQLKRLDRRISNIEVAITVVTFLVFLTVLIWNAEIADWVRALSRAVEAHR